MHYTQHTCSARQKPSPTSRIKTALKFTEIKSTDANGRHRVISLVTWSTCLGTRLHKLSVLMAIGTVHRAGEQGGSFLEKGKYSVRHWRGEMTTPTDTAEKGASLCGVRGCQVYPGHWLNWSLANCFNKHNLHCFRMWRRVVRQSAQRFEAMCRVQGKTVHLFKFLASG
jgi:hypothetical protein